MLGALAEAYVASHRHAVGVLAARVVTQEVQGVGECRIRAAFRQVVVPEPCAGGQVARSKTFAFQHMPDVGADDQVAVIQAQRVAIVPHRGLDLARPSQAVRAVDDAVEPVDIDVDPRFRV